MEITVNFEYVNWIAVLVATVATFVLGGIWYAPKVFGYAWARENGFEFDKMKERNMPLVFFTAFLAQWLTASLFAAVIGPNAEPGYAVTVGLLVGSFFVTTSIAINYIFENRSVKLLLINGGYHIVAFAIMGAIIANMQ